MLRMAPFSEAKYIYDFPLADGGKKNQKHGTQVTRPLPQEDSSMVFISYKYGHSCSESELRVGFVPPGEGDFEFRSPPSFLCAISTRNASPFFSVSIADRKDRLIKKTEEPGARGKRNERAEQRPRSQAVTTMLAWMGGVKRRIEKSRKVN